MISEHEQYNAAKSASSERHSTGLRESQEDATTRTIDRTRDGKSESLG